MNRYDIGDLVRLSALFTTTEGTPTDPTTLELQVRQLPAGAVLTATYPGDLVRASAGAYYLDYSPPARGHYGWRWAGTGAVQAAAEGTFLVRPSGFLP